MTKTEIVNQACEYAKETRSDIIVYKNNFGIIKYVKESQYEANPIETWGDDVICQINKNGKIKL